MKTLKSAFYEYNIKSNIEYLKISNQNYDFSTIKTKDIVFVSKYKYKTNKQGQYHLFLVVKKYGIYIHAMLITSNVKKEWYQSNIFVKKNSINNLNRNSLIKTDNIYLIYKNNIINKIGMINEVTFNKCIILNKLLNN